MLYAVVYIEHERGGVLTPPPKPLTRFFQGRRGSMCVDFSTHTPPLYSPHGGVRRRPKGQPRAASPSGLLLAGGRRETRAWLVVTFTFAAPALASR